MCLIYRPEHLGNHLENTAKRMCSHGSCTVTLPAVHNHKTELPYGDLLSFIFAPPFVSYGSKNFWMRYLFFVRGNPPHGFPLPFTFCLCDCNGHSVLNLPLTHTHTHTHTHTPSICFCFSFLLIRCLTDASRHIFLYSFYTLGLVWQLLHSLVCKAVLPVSGTSMGIWVQGGDGG